jgi:ATPase subunit of ABC transporter with duplicated ATPase domains
LLDEPTNHLDIDMLEWLEDWLNASSCGALIVSHDRTFLDHTVTRILEMDPQRGFHEYAGNFGAYQEQRQAEIERQWAEYKDQQQAIKTMQQDIARVKAQAAYTERQASSIRIGGPDMKIKGFKSYQQGIAKKVAKSQSQEKSWIIIWNLTAREKPQQSRPIKLEFRKRTTKASTPSG